MASPDDNRARLPANAQAGLVVARVAGAPVVVAPTWLLFIAFITIQFAPLVERDVPGIGGARYAVSFAFGVFLGLSVLAHEVAHALTARHFGLPVERIWLTFFAGHTAFTREPDSPWRMFAVAGAGPFANGVIAVAAWLGWNAMARSGVGAVVLGGLAWTNGVVAVYNLLPGLPLDGGQLLRSLIWRVTHDQRRGIVGAAWSGQILAALTGLLGLVIFVRAAGEQHSDSSVVFDGVWIMLIAAMTYASSAGVLRQQRLRDKLPRLSARTLTRRAVPVTADVPLAEAVRRAQEYHARGLVIVDGEGRPTGVVNEAAVISTPVERRPWIDVGTVSRRIEADHLVSAQLAGEELLRRLQSAPASEYVVVEPDGAIYGVLAAADVAAALRN